MVPELLPHWQWFPGSVPTPPPCRDPDSIGLVQGQGICILNKPLPPSNSNTGVWQAVPRIVTDIFIWGDGNAWGKGGVTLRNQE